LSFSLSTNAAFAVAEPTHRTFQRAELSWAISNLPVDDHFPVISLNPANWVLKTGTRSTADIVERPPEGAALDILAPTFALIRPTPQDAINLLFTSVS
jgi:hypothetical protein